MGNAIKYTPSQAARSPIRAGRDGERAAGRGARTPGSASRTTMSRTCSRASTGSTSPAHGRRAGLGSASRSSSTSVQLEGGRASTYAANRPGGVHDLHPLVPDREAPSRRARPSPRARRRVPTPETGDTRSGPPPGNLPAFLGMFGEDARLCCSRSGRDGEDRGTSHRLGWEGGPLVIGRSRSADLPIQDPLLSRRQCRLVFEAGRGDRPLGPEQRQRHLRQRAANRRRSELRTGDLITFGRSWIRLVSRRRGQGSLPTSTPRTWR